MRWILFYPCFSSEGTKPQRCCFLLECTQFESRSWTLSSTYPPSLLSPIVRLLPSIESPLSTLHLQDWNLFLEIKVCKCDHKDKDTLTTVNSPFLSMHRINEAGARKEKLDRKKKTYVPILTQIIYWSKWYNLSPSFLKCRKEECYRLHSIVTKLKWDNI